MIKTYFLLALAWLAALAANGKVVLPGVFGDHMVLQRGKPIPIFGTASPGEVVTVEFARQSVSTKADAQGDWEVRLPAKSADNTGRKLVVTGSNALTFEDVLVGDVWLCSGQSNMDMGLDACDRKEDVAGANFPEIRSFRTPLAAAGQPLKSLKENPQWTVCSPTTAGRYSATAFYFARKIYQETGGKIPLGLLVSSVGGTPIDLWLSPEGLIDFPVLHPLLSQPVLPGGPFSLAYGMIHPLAPYGLKGAIWYQGENAEKTRQSPDSYYLKMRALVEGWKRLWGMDDFAFYYVLIANWGELPKDATPVFNAGGWDADTRLQQVNALAIPHSGCASALDIGDSSMGDRIWDGWHPKDKLDVGERLAIWAIKNDYGRPNLEASGPILREAYVAGNVVTCSFDHADSGLMVGSRKWYEPTRRIENGKLKQFVIAGAEGKWFPAEATIRQQQVLLSSPSVPEPHKISYACWQNPEGCNLYNAEGLPAAPFHVENLRKVYKVTATSRVGGTITPAGTREVPQRKAVLYTVVPDGGNPVQDVRVDGKSVGSVTTFTFDPVESNHTIEATFFPPSPKYTITAQAGDGGVLNPAGVIKVRQGENITFHLSPETGNKVNLSVDGTSLGPRSAFQFTDVRKDHSLTATFSATIRATAGYGGTIHPDGTVPVSFGSNQAFTLTPQPGYALADLKVDGASLGPVGTHTFTNVTGSHAIAARFRSVEKLGTGTIPQPEQLLFACRGEALADTQPIGTWAAFRPENTAFKAIGLPGRIKIDGHKYAQTRSESADGFMVGSHTTPLPCNGASLIVVAKPIRNGAGAAWTSIVDVFYDRLVLGIRNDSGLVCVRRNGSTDNSREPIPDGQITILSLVVQPDGSYQVFANGLEIMSLPAAGRMTALVPGVAGPFANSITIGRNAPDGWTTFNGAIGEVFLYKTALSNEERRQLESLLAKSLE